MPRYVSKQIPGKPALAEARSPALRLWSAAPGGAAGKGGLAGGGLPALPAWETPGVQQDTFQHTGERLTNTRPKNKRRSG